MCFVSYRITTPLRYAVKDIPIYKVLKKDLTSPIYDFHYERNKVYYTPLLVSLEKFKIMKKILGYVNEDPYIVVNEGFHSYALNVIPHLFEEEILINAIIPKGSWYYYNTRQKEYVSDQIKILDETTIL